MSYAPVAPDLVRRAATYIDKILKGAKPADLPVEQASRYQLVINLKTAKALGIDDAADAACPRRRGDRMNRREFIAALGGAAVSWPLAARAQQKRIPRLCFLTFDPGTLRTRSPRFDGFFQGLQDLGYVNARNIEISYLSADNNGDRFPALIDECLSLRPDVIAVTTTPAAHLLKKATRDIPIVMVALGDPLGTGPVDSLSRPSENITGMSLMVPEMAVKRLELLRELIPGISRVLVLSFLADPKG